MPKKNPPQAELLPPAEAIQVSPNLNALLTAAVERKVAEVMACQDGLILQPFLQSKRVSDAIRRLQTVTEQRKGTYYFEDWGCMVCHTRKRSHDSLGMCGKCARRVTSRMRISLRRRMEKHESAPAFIVTETNQENHSLAPAVEPQHNGIAGITDLVEQARRALRPPKDRISTKK